MVAARIFTYAIPHPMTGEAAMQLSETAQNFPYERLDCLWLSFDSVSAIDASGVAVLVRLYSHLVKLGKRMQLVACEPKLVKLLAEAGLADVIEVTTRVKTID